MQKYVCEKKKVNPCGYFPHVCAHGHTPLLPADWHNGWRSLRDKAELLRMCTGAITFTSGWWHQTPTRWRTHISRPLRQHYPQRRRAIAVLFLFVEGINTIDFSSISQFRSFNIMFNQTRFQYRFFFTAADYSTTWLILSMIYYKFSAIFNTIMLCPSNLFLPGYLPYDYFHIYFKLSPVDYTETLVQCIRMFGYIFIFVDNISIHYYSSWSFNFFFSYILLYTPY